MTDTEAVAILDHWASETYLTWRMQRASEGHWYCKLDPGYGINGMRFFCDKTAAGARHHVFCAVYGPTAARMARRHA